MSNKQNDIWNESQHELAEEKKSMSKKMVVSKPAILKEHKHLLKVLKTGKGRKEEFNKQRKELKEYK